MSTEETQQAESTEETQQVSEEVTLEQDIETSIKGNDVEEIEVTDEEITAELEAMQAEANPLDPPPKWDRRYKDAFADLGKVEKGRAYQQAMIDLYTEQQGYATQIEQERSQLRKFAEPLQAALEPFNQFITASGATPDQMVRQSLALAMRLQQDPKGTILGLAQRANINLNELGENAPYVDPHAQRLEEQIRRMRAEQQAEKEQSLRAHQQRVMAETEQQVQTFRGAKDEQGKPKYPHVDLVEGEMAMLIRGNPNLSLEDAYNQACKLSDQVAQAEESRKRAEEAARKAAKAKKEQLAAKRVDGKPGIDKPSEGDLEDDIRKIYRQQQQAA